jgi:hypothetical protein
MEIFNKQSKFNESIYEIIENAFQNESQECTVDEIIRNVNFSDVQKVLEILVSQKKYDEKRIKKLKLDVDKAEHKYCMPEGINTKEEHAQYLKDIGREKYIKDLEHFKDVHVGLYVIDKMIDDIFTDTPEEKDCKTVVEAYLVQQFKRLKSLMWRIS